MRVDVDEAGAHQRGRAASIVGRASAPDEVAHLRDAVARNAHVGARGRGAGAVVHLPVDDLEVEHEPHYTAESGTW